MTEFHKGDIVEYVGGYGPMRELLGGIGVVREVSCTILYINWITTPKEFVALGPAVSWDKRNFKFLVRSDET